MAFLVLKTGSTLPELRARRGDFEDWIAAGLGVAAAELDVRPVHQGAPLPEPSAPEAVLVTGSSAMVSAREPWSESAAAWLRGVVEAGTPLLAICYGHQLLAHALGGRVGANPRGREIGSVAVELLPEAARDALFAGLEGPLGVQATHLEAVLALPPGARLLGRSARDPYQAFAVGPRAWGVQFHPEFDADVMRGYIRGRRDAIAAEGLDPDALLEATRDGPHGRQLLARFADLVRPPRDSASQS